MTDEKVIKLSQEQIAEKQIQLFKTKTNLEMAELNILQVERAIKENIPQKEAMAQLNNLKKQAEVHKHNVIALTEQIEKGEL